MTALTGLSWRLVHIQINNGDYYTKLVEAEHIKRMVLHADRGRILDSTGSVLAGNTESFSLLGRMNHLTDPQICKTGVAAAEGLSSSDVRRLYSREEIKEKYRNYVVRTLASPLGIQEWELARMIGKAEEKKLVEFTVAKDIEPHRLARLKELMSGAKIRGFYESAGTRRFYPNPLRLTQVLGFLNHEGVPIYGVERMMEPALRGTDGYRFWERDRRGREIAAFEGEIVEAVHGHDVYLTIDQRIQEIVEGTLDEVGDNPEEVYLPLIAPEKVSIVVMDPNSGAVLALANRPHFDLETREGIGGRKAEFGNASVSAMYEPGSTFKITTLAGVYNEGIVSPQTLINCDYGRLVEHGVTLRDSHPNGELTVQKLFARSSNIGIYKLARQLGRKKFYDYTRDFGFGSITGIGTTREIRGLVNPPSQWSGISLSRMAMGHEIAVTPIQMCAALSAIANGGEYVRPRIVESIRDRDGRIVQPFGKEVVRRVISEEAAKKVRRAMAAVVEEGGTAPKAAIPGYSVAGKTGTADKYDPVNGGYMDGRYVLSFGGFVPAENPQIAMIVVVDDPKVAPEKRYGGSIAAPIFQRIGERVMKSLNVAPTFPDQLALAQ
ncbi:penicillin-binding protein 2 [Verrucomicrobiales bacterium]|nr:penicillin-binding protein 2 [Verrucomicrobiales bacterium]